LNVAFAKAIDLTLCTHILE